MIKALCGLERVISNVNIPNKNLQITNLKNNDIVETNAVFERDSIRPIIAGALPADVLKLVTPHLENHETVLKAALTCDKSLIVKAFLNDPLVKGRASRGDVEKLVDDMIHNTIKYLPKEWN